MEQLCVNARGRRPQGHQPQCVHRTAQRGVRRKSHETHRMSPERTKAGKVNGICLERYTLAIVKRVNIFSSKGQKAPHRGRFPRAGAGTEQVGANRCLCFCAWRLGRVRLWHSLPPGGQEGGGTAAVCSEAARLTLLLPGCKGPILSRTVSFRDPKKLRFKAPPPPPPARVKIRWNFIELLWRMQ